MKIKVTYFRGEKSNTLIETLAPGNTLLVSGGHGVETEAGFESREFSVFDSARGVSQVGVTRMTVEIVK